MRKLRCQIEGDYVYLINLGIPCPGDAQCNVSANNLHFMLKIYGKRREHRIFEPVGGGGGVTANSLGQARQGRRIFRRIDLNYYGIPFAGRCVTMHHRFLFAPFVVGPAATVVAVSLLPVRCLPTSSFLRTSHGMLYSLTLKVL